MPSRANLICKSAAGKTAYQKASSRGLATNNDPVLRDNIKAQAPLLQRTLYSPTLGSSLLVLGVDLFSEAGFRDFQAPPPALDSPNSNQLFRFLLDPRAIAVSEELAKRHKLRLGSEITLFVGAQRKTFKVSTLLQGEGAGRAFGGDFALLDIATAQEAFGLVGRLSQIDLQVEESKVADVKRVLERLVPPDAQVQRPAQRSAQVADLLRAFQLNLSALSCISLFVGAFLIYNAIATAVVRRRSEVGTLRALGASRSQLLKMFLLEAALIGIVGSVAGFALGLALAHLTLQAVSSTVSALYIVGACARNYSSTLVMVGRTSGRHIARGSGVAACGTRSGGHVSSTGAAARYLASDHSALGGSNGRPRSCGFGSRFCTVFACHRLAQPLRGFRFLVLHAGRFCPNDAVLHAVGRTPGAAHGKYSLWCRRNAGRDIFTTCH
jgi:hypothetical protein